MKQKQKPTIKNVDKCLGCQVNYMFPPCGQDMMGRCIVCMEINNWKYFKQLKF